MSIIGSFFTRRIERQHDNFLIEKYKSIQRDPVFSNVNSALYISKHQLNDHDYLRIKLVCRAEINTIAPIGLTFQSKNNEHTIFSEYSEVVGDYSGISKIGITDFDIDYTMGFEQFLKNEAIIRLLIDVPNSKLICQPFTLTLDRFNEDAILELINQFPAK